MSEVTVAKLEMQREKVKKLVELNESVFRLRANKDFDTVITKGFCLSEAARYAKESADPMLTPVQRADALGIAQAAGHLERFLAVIDQMAQTAERDLVNIEEYLAELRAEEDAQ